MLDKNKSDSSIHPVVISCSSNRISRTKWKSPMKWNHFLLRLGCCVFSFETLPGALGILLAQNSFHPSSQRAPLITPSKRNGSAEMFWRNLNTPSNLRWFMSLPDWDISRLGIHRIFILVFPLQQQWRIYQLSTHTLDGWPQKNKHKCQNENDISEFPESHLNGC